MQRLEVIKDGRTLNAISKKYGLEFDPKFKYCISKDTSSIPTRNLVVGGKSYGLYYFDGCFYPFVCVKYNA